MNNPLTLKSKQAFFPVLLLSMLHYVVFGQVPRPADPQSTPILLSNAVLHIGNGQLIQNGSVAFEQGKIAYAGPGENITIDLTGYEVIDLAGQHVYPGLIMPASRLGLEEIGSLRPTKDYAEVGDINPNVRALISYNTDSELIATMRFNGILLAQTTPETGIFSGTSSIMALDGWNWEDAVYKADDGVHLIWPVQFHSGSFFNPGRRENNNYDETVKQINRFMQDARSYYDSDGSVETNLKLEAMKPLFDGTRSLFVHANSAREILQSLQLISKFDVEKVVLVGGDDAYHVKDYLKDNNIPVILGNVHRVPSRPEEDYDLPYKLPSLLQKEGILVSLAYTDRLQGSRNLPFHAGTAAAYGLSKEEALTLVTLNTAKILGIDEITGSLETGKDANIVVSAGDLLDMRTSKVTRAYIQGKTIELEGLQQRLYQRFRSKYEQQGY